MDDRDLDEKERARLELTRREALKLLAAGIAAAQAGCLRPPGQEILPYVERMPEHRPGVATWYATTLELDGYGTGILAETHEGRPTKIEGNPLHPASLGATTAWQQAAVYQLYDPHRLSTPLRKGQPTTWARLDAALRQPPPGPLWLVMPPQSSPVVRAALDRLREARPDTRVVFHGALDRRSIYGGTALAFGRPLAPQLDLSRAEVVVALDADLLGELPMSLAWAYQFSPRRRLTAPSDEPARLYAVEPMPTPTGSLADHRLARPAGQVAAVALAVLAELRRLGRAVPALPAAALLAATRIDAEALAWARATAADLVAHAGRGAVMAGPRQPPATHALAALINAAAGNVGQTVSYTEPAIAEPLGGPALADLAAAIDDDAVGALVMIGTNPLYDAPGGLELGARLRRVPLSVHHTLYPDETSAAAGWAVPLSHDLERWGDARAWDGTASLLQPTVRQRFAARSAVELVAGLAGERLESVLALLTREWRGPSGPLASGEAWQDALARGRVPGSAFARQSPTPALAAGFAEAVAGAMPRGPHAGVEIDLAPSPALYDGRFAGCAWLQELPHPITKLTWGNAAMLGPASALALGVEDGALLRVEGPAGAVEVPAVVVPGHAEGCVTLEIGYGRRAPGQPIADGVGVAVMGLAKGRGVILPGGTVTPLGQRARLARTQEHFEQHHRHLALFAELPAYRANPDFTAEMRGPLPTLLGPERPAAELQWAMSIDTTVCTGCSACVIACQAENNVPVVGPEGVASGRAMHWLRIDTYFTGGDPAAPERVHQPMLCQHCEHAPCEYVCPVFATQHSPDGLNEMVYNRCIGTRFCSNNCPYKVRRFNWFDYNQADTPLALQRNPDVTVRGRGVMEKCTYCVQRIRGAEIRARMEKRAIAPGEVVTACQQACPMGAIQFGALEHRETPMVKWRLQPRVYGALHELGTRPRTMYLAKIRNPNPLLARGRR
jgi:molybdopterin-containing oxidoreductase family iron-sulfur binding subunit